MCESCKLNLKIVINVVYFVFYLIMVEVVTKVTPLGILVHFESGNLLGFGVNIIGTIILWLITCLILKHLFDNYKKYKTQITQPREKTAKWCSAFNPFC